ncbi:MAG: P-protein [Candidatus Parcubacteria bacterium]|jgi:chorismate mutase/prephenate dehydratase
MEMCFLGPLGTNSHEVAEKVRSLFEDKKPPYSAYVHTTLVNRLCESNTEVLLTASNQQCLGVIALENSTAGLVDETKRFWLDRSGGLKRVTNVIGEFHLPVEHCLLAHPSITGVSQLTAVMSYPHALAQCRNFLDAHKHLERIPSASTAAAAKLVSERPDAVTTGVIASRLAATIYGLKIMQDHIEDSRDNVTRFHILGPSMVYPTGNDRTAIIFEIPDVSGALVDVLSAIRPGGVNLSSIHSIPLGVEDRFAFYCEFDRHHLDPRGEAIITRLETLTSRLIVLGSFPQSQKGK